MWRARWWWGSGCGPWGDELCVSCRVAFWWVMGRHRPTARHSPWSPRPCSPSSPRRPCPWCRLFAPPAVVRPSPCPAAAPWRRSRSAAAALGCGAQRWCQCSAAPRGSGASMLEPGSWLPGWRRAPRRRARPGGLGCGPSDAGLPWTPRRPSRSRGRRPRLGPDDRRQPEGLR